MRKIVLNIPHSSVNGIFDPEIGKWPRNPFFVNDCIRRWTDWHSDMLFASDNPNVSRVVFPLSRFVCDVERLNDDPLEKDGQGILYTSFSNVIRGELTNNARWKLMSLYDEHRYALASNIPVDGSGVLIDCHSFPSDMADNDICVGFNDDDTYDPDVVKCVVDGFVESGYSVKLNEPYANSLSPNFGFKYSSVMIEVNKRVYMDETTMLLNSDSIKWMRWFGCLERIYESIIALDGRD
ncbi:MAG: N-formylglutamate amidohydrolase [Paludibacteraceae bacterium]|nr:N-formylglutamate amidohydrolase [Paludibacteraceae bacterium]